jgi:hypothetical protein
MSQFFSAVVVTPGTPQKLQGTTVPAAAVISGGLAGIVAARGQTIVLSASAANTAAKSIFWGGPSMSVSAKTGIGGALLPGASIVIPVNDTEVDLGDFWIDTDSVAASTEKLFVSVF